MSNVVTNKWLTRLKIALALIYVIGAFSWTMPESFPLKPVIRRVVKKPFIFLGLWQGWEMFAPNPISQDVYVSVLGTLDNGKLIEWDVTRMDKMGLATRYQMERWRKFCNDNLRVDENRVLWPEAARWFAKALGEDQGRKVVKLEMIRHWRPAAIPDQEGNIPPRPEWESYIFHTETF